MSWIQKLYETYEACAANPAYTDPPQPTDGQQECALIPECHISQQAHIRVAITAEGNFARAELLPPKSQFVIPATEDSASRSGTKAPPHPLCDKIRYCARDFPGKNEGSFHVAYVEQLSGWCVSEYGHPMVKAVLAYVTGHDLLKDLAGVLEQFRAAKSKYPTVKEEGDLVIVWSVLLPEIIEHDTDKNKGLQQAWIRYATAQMKKNKKGFCMVKGEETSVTSKHPRNIRRPGDGAKLISSNDSSNFTFRGRFGEPEQACTVGYEVSQKAHSALSWLIQRQGYRSGEQAVVAWAVSGAPLPGPCDDDPFNLSDADFENFPSATEETAGHSKKASHYDIGQAFSERLRMALNGYRAKLNDSDGIVIMAVEAASPGRLSITFYREEMPGEYLDRLQAWQEDCAWRLPAKRSGDKENKKPGWIFCAPAPKDIAFAAYGRRLDEKLQKATVERLLPCIVDNAPLPRDLVESCVRRACARGALEAWEKEEVLAVACALYRGWRARNVTPKEKKRFEMSLDESITSRDYLYGRLLAVAEYIERTALDASGEDRPTNAERLMQRFADRPGETWRQLELQLSPYMQRLQNSKKAGLLVYARREMQKIYDMMAQEDFVSKAKLSGEFLLGYHCQKSAFYTAKNDSNGADNTDE